MKNKKSIAVILSTVTTTALLANYVEIYENGLKSINNIMVVSPAVVAIIFLVIVYFYNMINNLNYKINLFQKILLIFFSFIIIIGKSYEYNDTWNLIFKNKITMLISFIGIVGYYVFFYYIFIWLNYKISNIDLSKIQFNTKKNIISLFDSNPFIISLIVILLFWTIYIIAFYPGILTPDSSYQILQAFNIHTKYSEWIIPIDVNINITNHHPVLHSLIIGNCLDIGRMLLNDNFGIFIYTALQTLILSTTLAYTIKYLKKINISSKIRLIILLIYCLVPMFPFYAITAVKDTIYTAFIILFIIRLYDFITNNKYSKIDVPNMIFLLLIMLMISFTRNNGIYLVVLSTIPLIFYSKKNIKRIMSLMLTCILIYKAYTGLFLPYLRISDTSVREALSVPFQQTARYIKEHEEDLTKKEKNTIDKILVFDTISKKYDPEISDPVKNEYNKYSTKEDLVEYFKVWIDELKKHPTSYIQAYISNTYGYFYPSNNRWYIYYKKNNIVNNKGNVNYTFNQSTKYIRKMLKNYGNFFRSIPGIGLISNIGFNTCVILFYIVCFLIQDKKRKYIIVLLPHLITIIFCLLSPVNNYFRYAMPYVFALPITTIFFLKNINDK